MKDSLGEAARLESLGEWGDAADIYERLLGEDRTPDERALTLVHLARCLRETDRHDEAEERLDAAVALVDEAAGGRTLGLIKLEEARLAEHSGDLRSAGRRMTKALQLLEPFRSDWVQAIIAMAGLDRALGEWRRAAERLELVDADSLSGSELADYLGALGAVQLARGDYRHAEETLRRALELDEAQSTDYGAADTRLLLAETYLGRGDRERAKRLIEEVKDDLEAVGDNAALSDTYPLLGRLYEESGDYVNAARCYQDGLNLDISGDDTLGRARAYRRLARTFRKRGDLRRAADYLEDGRRLIRDNDVERAAVFTEQGNIALESGDFAEAEDLFRRAKQLIEEDGDERRTAIAARNLARALREKGDLGRAETLMREAIGPIRERGDLRELDDLLDDLGEVLIEQDRYDEALVALEESFQLDQQIGAVASQARSQMLRGRAFMRLGERDKAGKSLKAALDVYHRVGDEVGESTARHLLGEWYASEGQLGHAIEQFRAGQAIDGRHGDRLGLARAARSLASVYRRKGDTHRARELLDEAERELSHTDDTAERSLLQLEVGRLAVARGAYSEAEEHIRAASRAFDALDSPGQVAICHRLLGMVASARGHFDQATSLFAKAETDFERNHDLPELGELYDNIGELHLRAGRLDEAEASIQKSLELDRRMGWHRGKGSSLLLLAAASLRRNDPAQAHKRALEALTSFREVGDEVGESEAHMLLGDCDVVEGDHTAAMRDYKAARRIDMRHGDGRGLSRCYRKLGHVYLLRHEWIRAEEAFDQAQEYLQGVEDPRELAMLALELGNLQAALNDHASAVHHFRQAVRQFDQLGDQTNLNLAYQGLVASHHAQGNVAEALRCMREMGVEHANLWALMVRSLHPTIATAAEPCFLDGQYGPAVKEAYGALESSIRTAASQVVTETHLPIGKVLDAWLQPEHRSGSSHRSDKLTELCKAMFSLVRNPLAHSSALEVEAKDAFIALALADYAASRLDARAAEVAQEALAAAPSAE